MRLTPRCYRAITQFDHDVRREFYVYAYSRQDARQTLYRGLVRNPGNPLAGPARLYAFGGRLVSIERVTRPPVAKLIADNAPAREVRK